MSNTDALTAVYNHLSSEATFSDSAKTKDLDLRVSYGPSNNANNNSNNKTIYYDLRNKDWDVIVIDKNGWTLKESTEVPVTFRRYQNIQIAQVNPLAPGDYSPDI